jgi:hypothetical protein
MSEKPVSVTRLFGGPIIRPFAERRMGGNVCGPSLIRTPDWLPCRLGRYHLYFAHHMGAHIRLAYADRLEGPWEIHAPGALDIAQTPTLYEHIASPDVHVDEERRELRMYFHGVSSPEPISNPEQSTCVAHSFDGLTFAARAERLGPSYFRVWEWEGAHYALSVGGRLWRSPDGLTPFEAGGRPEGLDPRTRHLAVLRRGARLWVAWTVIGDAPERIYLGHIDLTADWRAWRIEAAREILRPETDWEGAAEPCEPSAAGIRWLPANQLRDPCFFSEDGVDYLLYAVAGESGIAIARIDGLAGGDAP